MFPEKTKKNINVSVGVKKYELYSFQGLHIGENISQST